MKHIPGGKYLIGTDSEIGFPPDREGPAQIVSLTDFYIEETTVTNQAFKQFVEATGYVTEAEAIGWSFVFHYFLTAAQKLQAKRVDNLSWWYAVQGANWAAPEGFDSTITARLDHPVVHVSRNDAVAYCQWAGKRLPTEAEWEVAAKGGTEFQLYPWGDDLLKDGQYHCNIWQGEFPKSNTRADGYLGTAPAKTYEPNGHGLYQMIGNVWEWCANPRGIELEAFNTTSGKAFWRQHQHQSDLFYGTRGGSFLCHQSYCKRYRIAARNGNSAMSSSNNSGFRCVRDLV